MLNANRFKLGVFVVSGVFLIVAGLFIHGLSDMFGPRYEFFTVFDESVQGLEIGSDVKYKGVKLGSVSQIQIYDQRYIKVTMEIVPDTSEKSEMGDKFKAMAKRQESREMFNFIQTQIDKGLSCNLAMSGITGIKFIELDHNGTDKDLVKMPIDDLAYIPAKRSLLTGTVLSLNEALSRIAMVDFAGISNELKVSLKAFSSKMNDPRVDSIFQEVTLATKELREVMHTVNKQLSSAELSTVVNNLDGALKEIRVLASTVNRNVEAAQVGKLSASLDKTLNSTNDSVAQFKLSISSIESEFNTTLEKFQTVAEEAVKMRQELSVASQKIVDDGSDVKVKIVHSLSRLDKALQATTELLEMIEQDPASLLKGKSARD